jgi:hypothetical protein
MLIEQAFVSLPEIMLGAGYARQEYEAGIVSAFSLSVLQELNGRNVPKPISCMCAEKKYMQDFRLRADLYVNLRNTFSGSQALSRFGFRFSNWIEAKFFRQTKGTVPSTQNLGMMAADLLRLTALPPIELGKKDSNGNALSITGRYLLHVYQGDPLVYINPRRKATGAEDRIWPTKLLLSGQQTIQSLELDQETRTFLKQVGEGLKTAKAEITVTNFILKSGFQATTKEFTFVLSRIEAFTLEYNNKSFQMGADRSIAGENDHEILRSSFAQELKKSEKLEKSNDADLDDDQFSEEEDTP